jgi:undecaprenyl diphosphate synthase
LREVQKGSFFSRVDSFSYRLREPAITFSSFSIALDAPIVEDQKRAFTNLGKNILKTDNLVPHHIAIIPDGNRRWAKQKGLNVTDGHEQSASLDNVMAVLNEARDLGVKYMTFWAFSTENWKREEKEVKFLFNMLEEWVPKLKDKLVESKIRFRHIGRKDRIPGKLAGMLEDLEDCTKSFTEYNLQLCLDYGGRDEIARAINRIISSGVRNITEEDLARYLDTHGLPDPDLVIRTSGEKRTSGFMPFQSGYSELYFTNCYFPDFGPNEIRSAVEEFANRKRNFGK